MTLPPSLYSSPPSLPSSVSPSLLLFLLTSTYLPLPPSFPPSLPPSLSLSLSLSLQAPLLAIYLSLINPSFPFLSLPLQYPVPSKPSSPYPIQSHFNFPPPPPLYLPPSLSLPPLLPLARLLPTPTPIPSPPTHPTTNPATPQSPPLYLSLTRNLAHPTRSSILR